MSMYPIGLLTDYPNRVNACCATGNFSRVIETRSTGSSSSSSSLLRIINRLFGVSKFRKRRKRGVWGFKPPLIFFSSILLIVIVHQLSTTNVPRPPIKIPVYGHCHVHVKILCRVTRSNYLIN